MADTKEITVQGVTVQVTAPYAEGHQCTAAEAKALNQVRAENVRNNTAKQIKDLKEELGEDSPELTKQAAALVDEYDKNYEFTLASVGGGRAAMSPVEKEARSIARDFIGSQLREQGITQKAYLEANGPDAIKNKIAEFAEHPKIVEMAQKAIKEREKNAGIADGLKL